LGGRGRGPLGHLVGQGDKALRQGLKLLIAPHIGGHLGRLGGRDVTGELPAAQMPLQDEVRSVGHGLAGPLTPQEVLAQGAPPQAVDGTHVIQDLITLGFKRREGRVHGNVVSYRI